jgi:hypothetical protein
MGEVYRARDTRLGRDVAVKVLPQHVSASPEDRARFKREATTISSLNHSHICVLYDVGREGDTDYLVMELIEGETLAQRIARGPLPTADVLRIGAQIADGLDRAHRAGVVHRDLKPGNVMLTKGGAKLMDFGLARTASPEDRGADGKTATAPGHQARSDEPITAKGMVVGTFQYMAPEQLEGKADARSDIWALGCVIYEMATGKRAFDGRSQASLIGAIMNMEPAPMAQLSPLSPPALEHYVRRCLAKDLEDRWQNAGDLSRELTWLAQSGFHSPFARQRVGRFPAWLFAGLAIAVGIGAGTFLQRSLSKRPPPQYHRLTFQRGVVLSARLAADGHSVVYCAAWGQADPQVYVTRPEGPEARSLELRDCVLLAASASGELLVETDHRNRQTLARVPMDGGAPRPIAEGISVADWAPDGVRIAAVRSVGSRDQLEFPIDTVLYETAGFISDARVSPRGDLVAIIDHPARGDGTGSVAVVGRDGKVRTLTRRWTVAFGLAWGAKGDEVWFTACETGLRKALYAVSLSGKERLIASIPGDLWLRDIGRDGTVLVSQESSFDRLVFRRRGGEERDVSWLDSSMGGDLSADGTTLLFAEGGESVKADWVTYIRRTDGSPAVRLGEGYPVALSPDKLWAMVIPIGMPAPLVLLPTGVGKPRSLPGNGIHHLHGFLMRAGWFPGGKRVFFSGVEPGHRTRTYIQDLDGGDPRAITPEGTTCTLLTPDGSQFLAIDSVGSWQIYPMTGGPPRPAPGVLREDLPICWSADSKSVYVGRSGGRIGKVLTPVFQVSQLDGRREALEPLVIHDPAGVASITSISLTPDGKYCAYSYQGSMSTLFAAHGLN